MPAAAAGRLADLFGGMVAADFAKAQPADLLPMLMDNTANAQSIEDMIVAGATELAQLSLPLRSIGASCNDCHAAHRNRRPGNVLSR